MKIFLAYGKEDLSEARRVFELLNRYAAFEVFFDEVSMMPGEKWRARVEREIRQSDYFILLFSSRSVNRRGFMHAEVTTALDVLATVPSDQIFLIPLKLDECDIPDQLAELHIIDLYPDWHEAMDRVVRAMSPHTRLIGRAPRSAARPDVWFACHKAYFDAARDIPFFFLEIGNRREQPFDITHVWYEDLDVSISIEPPSKPLPQRLEVGESWQTYIRCDEIPMANHPTIYERFGLRITGGETFQSIRNTDIPPRGSVPGGDPDITEILGERRKEPES